ncbi:branched-chain amino acid ABC transporter permease [Bordetella sp. N]|uniref:branched-chain amino acid ABC transporter permease n=1 Tax=Bordetella sp. N TaxID=1746199 RepID=UPI0007090BDC|nr:branched-chain amino acid ABC transporter permease [Bordetella sp. N]ALM83069.1 ABC transporter permease [Bordetella sp. N]
MGQLLFNGVLTGLLVALPALALSLVFSVLRFANFAIGAMLTVGGYLAYAFNVLLGWPLWAAAAASAVLTGVLAVGVDRLVYRPLRGRSSVTLLVASMGVSFFLENAVRFVAGNTSLGFAVTPSRPLRWAGLRIGQGTGTTVLVTLGALLAVWLVFRHTRLGRAMRAVADNASLAAVRGVSRDGVIACTWLLAGALSALAGVLVGLDTGIDPLMGWNYLLPVFAAAIVGGLANPMAAVFGAVALGVVSEVSTAWLPSHYRMVVAFAVMSACLLWRPAGVLGARWITR